MPTAEFERLDMVSALGGRIEYHASGGKCSRRRCDEDAPYAVLGGKRVKLPCQTHAAEETAAIEEAERLSRSAQTMAESGVTERLREFSFETYERVCDDAEGRAALAFGQRWVKTFLDTGAAPNVLMWGPVGCGKTGLAWSMVRALCERGHYAKVVNFAQLLDAMRDCYARKVPATHALAIGSFPVVVLDDLGAERPTEWACSELLGIVDRRYERGLPTIYVSNYAPRKLKERLGRDDEVTGERIVSRMSEGASKFEFRGSDRRLAA